MKSIFYYCNLTLKDDILGTSFRMLPVTTARCYGLKLPELVVELQHSGTDYFIDIYYTHFL